MSGRRAGFTDEDDRLARVLMAEWERAEGKPVSASYVATFADMARAVRLDREQRPRTLGSLCADDLGKTVTVTNPARPDATWLPEEPTQSATLDRIEHGYIGSHAYVWASPLNGGFGLPADTPCEVTS